MAEAHFFAFNARSNISERHHRCANYSVNPRRSLYGQVVCDISANVMFHEIGYVSRILRSLVALLI